MARPEIIDTKMHGRDGITAAYVVTGEKTALVETGPKSSIDAVRRGLEVAGVDSLDWIVVTHIHLDHAGAAGALAREFPEASVAVHHVGAPHLVDPSKLWSSASRIYGDAMDTLWGGVDPIDAARIVALSDGDKVDLGGRTLEAIETPGHAYHHHAFLDDATGIVFTGDALGVRLPDVGLNRPATPPPEFHLEKAVDSIRKLAALDPTALWLTHFGPSDEGTGARSVAETCDLAIEALRTWSEWVTAARAHTDDLDVATAEVQAKATQHYEGRVSPETIDRLEQTTSYRMNTWGYMRHFDKLAQSDRP